MPSITKPRFWLLTAGTVSAALLITFRVVTVDAAPGTRPAAPSVAPIAPLGEIPDPALDALIHRFALVAAGNR